MWKVSVLRSTVTREQSKRTKCQKIVGEQQNTVRYSVTIGLVLTTSTAFPILSASATQVPPNLWMRQCFPMSSSSSPDVLLLLSTAGAASVAISAVTGH